MPEALYFTESDEANRLIASDPLALLIGFAIDQQITVQQAFSGPLKLKQRLGRLDAAEIAATDPERLEQLFREKPGIHRFPSSMADMDLSDEPAFAKGVRTPATIATRRPCP